MKTLISIFREPHKWQHPAVIFGPEIAFKIEKSNPIRFLLFITDTLVFPDGANMFISNFGCLIHAIAVTWLEKNQALAIEKGITFGAINVCTLLAGSDYSDAHNPQVWRRAIITEEERPFYSLKNLSEIGILEESLIGQMRTLMQSEDGDMKIMKLLEQKYCSMSGYESYKGFNKTPLMMGGK